MEYTLRQVQEKMMDIIYLLFYCCAILPYKGKKTREICQRIALYNPGLTGFLLKEDEAKTKCGGIINLFFGVWSIIRADILLLLRNS